MAQVTTCAHNDPPKISFLYTSQPAWSNPVARAVTVWPQATSRQAATRRYTRECVRHMHNTNTFVVQDRISASISYDCNSCCESVTICETFHHHCHHHHHRLQAYNQVLKERSAVSVLVASVDDFARVAARGRDGVQGRQRVEQEEGVTAVMVRSCEHIHTRR
jgi:hypothetical protein